MDTSEWSDKFSVDVVGSSGKVSAKSKDGILYEVGFCFICIIIIIYLLNFI